MLHRHAMLAYTISISAACCTVFSTAFYPTHAWKVLMASSAVSHQFAVPTWNMGNSYFVGCVQWQVASQNGTTDVVGLVPHCRANLDATWKRSLAAQATQHMGPAVYTQI
jgi:hypothetical protein